MNPENIFQKQKRELEEIRNESFKQGIWQERDRIVKLIKLYEIGELKNLKELKSKINGEKETFEEHIKHCGCCDDEENKK